MQRLEDQLNARLFHRTTRSTSLTHEGEMFFASCQPGVMHIAQALEDMRELRAGPPKGRLRVSSMVTFGRNVLAPLLPGFHAEYPDVDLELMLDDEAPDFISDRIDVSFRSGRMEDSQIVARQIGPFRMLVCASPAYASWHGLPETLDELERHRCIHLRLLSGRTRDWEFQVDGQRQRLIPPSSRSVFNDDDLVLQAVLGGQGLAQLPAYQVGPLVESGRLVTCLGEHEIAGQGHYVCYLSRKHLPARIRAFIDYMMERIRQIHLPVAGEMQRVAA